MLTCTQNLRRAGATGLLAMFALAAPVALALADPIESQGGIVVLAISGLEIDLPALPSGGGYHISGSFALDENGGYDGRDVIDEFAGADLVAGTWISLGYFTAGAPAAVVAGVGLADGWTAQVDLWGATWAVAGGIWDFENDLGTKPALVACTQVGDGKALLIHRYFLTQPTTMTQAEMLAQFAEAAAPQAAWSAYRQQRVGVVAPLRRPEVRNRGEVEPARWEYLASSLLEVEIPDDGFVWLLRSDPEQGVDFLDRLAPALPEVSIEVLTLPGQACGETFDSIPLEKRSVWARNLPTGWTSGPQLVVDGELELTTCHENDGGVVIVGVFQGPTDTDVGYLAPLLTAIAEAADLP